MNETKPPTINRLDPAWAQFAASTLQAALTSGYGYSYQHACDHADAMIRERDRRDREERE